MAFKHIVNSFMQLGGLRLEKTISSFNNRLAKYGIKKEDYAVTDGEINFKKLGITLPIEKAGVLLKGYNYAANLSLQEGTKFHLADNGIVCVTIGGLSFYINEYEELFILNEVFTEGAYNFALPKDKKTVLIDIGMNVGITSLFFAGKPQVEKIFSFEPFKPTYQLALNNFSLNSAVAGKIKHFNFGLSQKENTLAINYSPKLKGRMGINGVPVNSGLAQQDIVTESIQLQPATKYFEEIQKEINSCFTVCKMDCEGSEFDIFNSLAESNAIAIPDVYLIEWHNTSPQPIVDKLAAHNFYTITTSVNANKLGMIYAIKKQFNK